VHLVFLPVLPPSPEEIAANNITLSDIQKVAEQSTIEWGTTGNGYLLEQSTKVRRLFKCPLFLKIRHLIIIIAAQRYWVGTVRQPCRAASMDRRKI
jgi:hypothetical protein